MLENAIKLLMKQKGFYVGPELDIVVKEDKEAFDMTVSEIDYWNMSSGNPDYNWAAYQMREGSEDIVGYADVTLADIDDNGKEYYIINQIGCRADITVAEFCSLIKKVGEPITAEGDFKGYFELAA